MTMGKSDTRSVHLDLMPSWTVETAHIAKRPATTAAYCLGPGGRRKIESLDGSSLRPLRRHAAGRSTEANGRRPATLLQSGTTAVVRAPTRKRAKQTTIAAVLKSVHFRGRSA